MMVYKIECAGNETMLVTQRRYFVEIRKDCDADGFELGKTEIRQLIEALEEAESNVIRQVTF